METTAKNNTSGTHQEKAKKLRKLRRWQIAVSLLGAAIVVWGVIEVVCLFLDYKKTEVSNDAQIEQYISPINLRASGYIKKIYFTEHQEVRKGDTLLVLDDREYKIRVMEAEAALKDAQAGATVIGATLQTTQTTASVYDASISEIEIRLAKLEKDRQRYQNLVQRNAATPNWDAVPWKNASSLQPDKPSPTFCPTLKNGLSPTTKRHKWRTCV